MKYTTVIEKLISLFNMIKTSWVDILFLGMIIIFLLLLAMKKLSKKKCFSFILVTYILLLGITIYTNLSSLSTVANSMSNQFFTNLYFPSVYVYLFVFIMINVVTLGSFLKPTTNNTYKIIHSVACMLMNYLFILILEMISKNKIDIFSKTSLFSNTDLVILLEISVNLFLLWVIALGMISITNGIAYRITVRRSNQELTQAPASFSPSALTVENNPLEKSYASSNPKMPTVPVQAISNETPSYTYQFIPTMPSKKPLQVKEEYSENPQLAFERTFANNMKAFSNSKYENEQLNNTFIPNEHNTVESITNHSEISMDQSFDLSSFIPRKQSTAPVTSQNKDSLFEQILNNKLPVIKEDVTIDSIEQEKNTYTLNDYRIFNKMLKDIREHNQSNTIYIDKNLEYRLITKYSTENYDMFKKMLKIYSN